MDTFIDLNDFVTTESNENMEFPKIYIPSCFFIEPNESCENIDDKPIFKKEYLINGLSFYEEPFEDTNVFQEFEITKDKEKIEIKILDGYSSVNDTSSDEDVEIAIQGTPYGFIINRGMLIPYKNWHSIISEQCGMKCLVCDMTVDKWEDHIKLKTHVDNLNKYDLYLLNEFDEDIMRKIGDNYQCLICDVFFNVSNIEKHFESREHSEQILYSVNQASDILEYFELQNDKNDDYSDNGKSNDSDVNESVISCNDENINDSNISSVDSENDDRSDICPKKKSNALILKEFAKLVDGEVKLEDDPIHMIVTRGNEEFFCMVCFSTDDISNKTKHYTNKEHLKKLNECTIVEKYKQYFVRKVNYKYCHCGVCNSLQFIYHIDEHIRYHKSKKSNTNQEKPQKNLNTEDQINVNNETRNLVNENINQESNEDLMCLNQNTLSISVSNLYTQLEQEAYCALCKVSVDITPAYRHTFDPTHIRLFTAATVKSSNHMDDVSKLQSQMSQLAIESTSTNQTKIESTSTNQTKIDVNESSENRNKTDLNESSGNLTKVEEPYNFEFIYLKLKNTYVKVKYKSYNGLINIGDGSHFCFLCSLLVFVSLKEHMEDENHLINLKNCHFIDKCGNHLIRQNSSAYHCCSCNIMFTKKQFIAHTTGQGIQYKSDKKTRTRDFKSGIKQINIKTLQESAASESEISVITRIDITVDGKLEIAKCKKIVVFDGKALKLEWDSWHGFTRTKSGYYCILCQSNLKDYAVNTHISEQKHVSVQEISFEKKFLPSLIRKINDNQLHCLICNVKVLDNSVVKHIDTNKHKHYLTAQFVDINNIYGKDIIYV